VHSPQTLAPILTSSKVSKPYIQTNPLLILSTSPFPSGVFLEGIKKFLKEVTEGSEPYYTALSQDLPEDSVQN
jgi:hypothetical protein